MNWQAALALALLATSGSGYVAETETHSRARFANRLEVRLAGGCPQLLVELQAVTAEFRAVETTSRPPGWETADEAALAFYAFNDAAYRATDDITELVGFLLRTRQGRYVFTNAVKVPYAFELTARLARQNGWTVAGLLHTHPGGRACQEEFSSEDRKAVLRGTTPMSYVRTPLGNVLFLDQRLAEKRSMRRGASVCPNGESCLAAHVKARNATAYASR